MGLHWECLTAPLSVIMLVKWSEHLLVMPMAQMTDLMWAQTLALVWGRQREWARALRKEPRSEPMTELRMALETELQLVRMMAEQCRRLQQMRARRLAEWWGFQTE